MKRLLLIFVVLAGCFAQSTNLCPVCQKKHLASKVYPGGGSSTAMGCISYYDEKGEFHGGDCNTSTWGYTCSRGHAWNVLTGGGRKADEVVITKSTEEKEEVGPFGTPFIIDGGSVADVKPLSFTSGTADNVVSVPVWECSADGNINLDPKIEGAEVVIHVSTCKDHKWVSVKARIADPQ